MASSSDETSGTGTEATANSRPGSARRWQRRIRRSVLSFLLVVAWGITILSISAIGKLLADGRFDLATSTTLVLVVFTPLWSGFTVLGTLVAKRSWD